MSKNGGQMSKAKPINDVECEQCGGSEIVIKTDSTETGAYYDGDAITCLECGLHGQFNCDGEIEPYFSWNYDHHFWIDDVANRLPTALLPKVKTWSSLLSAITQLKTERNNALEKIKNHNKMCKTMCESRDCDPRYRKPGRSCPDCYRDWEIE